MPACPKMNEFHGAPAWYWIFSNSKEVAFVRFCFWATAGTLREIEVCRFRFPVVSAIRDRTSVDFREYAGVRDLVRAGGAEIKA
jgi:hypothetical protein